MNFLGQEPIPADDVQPSPDGQWVLAHVMNQLYLIAMPVVGGEAPTVNVGTAAVVMGRREPCICNNSARPASFSLPVTMERMSASGRR